MGTHKQPEQREQSKVETKAGGNNTTTFTPTDKRSLAIASETCSTEGKSPFTLVCYHQVRVLCFTASNLTVAGSPAVRNYMEAVNFSIYSQISVRGN